MEIALVVIALLFFTTCSGLISASEIALFSLSSVTIKSYQKSKDPREQLIATLTLRPRELFVTLFVVNVAANILIQNTASGLFGEEASWLLKVGVPLILVVIFGELLPKYVALQNNVAISHAVAPLIQTLSRIVKPIQKRVLMAVVPISRVLFFFLRKDEPISRDEVEHVLKTSAQHGVLSQDEVGLVKGYLDLQESQVKELMRPREDILYYDVNKPLSKLTYLFVEKECTRIPVCDDNIENVKGIISATKYFLHHHDFRAPSDVLRFLDKPFFIPETTPVRKLLRQFNESQEEVALVVDEYSSIVGLIAHEDLIEVVIGEIVDQRDDLDLYTRSSSDTIIASGKMELTDFEELFGVALKSQSNSVTLGGWLTEQLGDIPKSGTQHETADFLFQILAADPNRVRSVYVRRLPQPNKGNSD